MAPDHDIPEVALVFEDDPGEVGSEGGRDRVPAPGEFGHRLPGPRIPAGVLGVALGIVAVVGIMAVNLGAGTDIAAVTSLAALGSSALPRAVASAAMAYLGTLGALVVVAAVCAGLVAWERARRRSGRWVAVHGLAVLAVMATAWMLTGLVATVTVGPVPYLVGPAAFVAALGTVLTSITPRPFRGLAGVVAAAIGVAVAASLVYAGSATVVGAGGSLVAGSASALLGIIAWNRWWAPVMDARDRIGQRMGGPGSAGWGRWSGHRAA